MEKADEYLKALNELRLLVFLECDGEECEDDAKNIINGEHRHFHQVKLTPRQFKRVSDSIILREREDSDLKPGYNMASVRMGGTFSPDLFDGLSSTI